MRSVSIRCRISGGGSSRASRPPSASRSRRERRTCRSRPPSSWCSRTPSRSRCSASTCRRNASGSSSWYPASAEPLADAQAEPLDELGHRLRLHLEAVALADPRELVRIGRHGPAEIGELAEELLEAGRRDDLEDPAGLVTRVPERVPLVPRLEDEIARARLDDVVAEQRAHPALEDEAVLVLARVQMERRRQRPRRHRMLDEREAVTGLRPVDEEPHADAAEEAFLCIPGTDDLDARRSVHPPAPFHWTVMSPRSYALRPRMSILRRQ